MKRALKIVGIVFLALVLLVVGFFVHIFSGAKPLQDGATVAGFAHTIKDGYVSCSIFDIGDGKVALIDACNDKEGKAVQAELQHRGLANDQVAAIFLTHGHPDHMGAVSLFPHAEIFALETEIPLAEGKTGSQGFLPKMMGPSKLGVKVTRGLKDGEVTQIGNVSVQAFAVPGHTVGSAAYLANGVLFLGDSADLDKDDKLHGAKGVFSDDEALNHASLRALAQKVRPLDVKALVPAHSGSALSAQPLFDFTD